MYQKLSEWTSCHFPICLNYTTSNKILGYLSNCNGLHLASEMVKIDLEANISSLSTTSESAPRIAGALLLLFHIYCETVRLRRLQRRIFKSRFKPVIYNAWYTSSLRRRLYIHIWELCHAMRAEQCDARDTMINALSCRIKIQARDDKCILVSFDS